MADRATATPELRKMVEVVPPGEFLREATVEGNTIQNVALLGSVSKNGRVYTRDAMNDAAKLYNGVQVFSNHPAFQDLTGTGGRRFEDLAGKVMNTRVAGDRVRGDIHLIEGEPIADKLKRLAEQMPDLAGFSHRAKGESERAEDGTVVIKRILEVNALEIVVDPATTDGLFESEIIDETEGKGSNPQEEADEMKDALKGMTIEELRAERPDLVTSLTEAVKAEVEEKGEQSAKLAEAQDRITEIEAEKKGLEKKLDEAELTIAARKREDLIDTKLAEAKLPEKAVTERFRTSLLEAKDEEAVDALIADRTELVEALPKDLKGGGTPKQPPRSVDKVAEGADGKPKEFEPVTDEVVAAAMDRAFS